MKLDSSLNLLEKLQEAEKLYLFLDYDGTLAEFAPTPDKIIPDQSLVGLLTKLSQQSNRQIAIISGRRLDHIRALLPIQGVVLAGTYGIEILDPSGKRVERLDFSSIRPAMEIVKPGWLDLLDKYPDLYLEDKGWSLALHAKFVEDELAQQILPRARLMVEKLNLPGDMYRILGGHKFLELAPMLANKGQAVDYILSSFPLNGALPVFIGDDDKDEEAFAAVSNRNGVAIRVGSQVKASVAKEWLASPRAVRQLLASLL